MAGFDAGSIDARLTLDRSAFQAGLDEARAKVDEFEAKKATARIDVDEGDSYLKIDVLDARLDILGAKEVKPRVKVDVDGEAGLDELDAKLVATKAAGAAAGGGGGLGLLMTTVLTLGPALVPLAAGLIGVVGALGAGLVAAGGGLAVFAASFIGNYQKLMTATKAQTAAEHALSIATTNPARAKALKELAAANSQLTGPMGLAATALTHLKDTWHEFLKETGPATFGIMSQGFNLLASVVRQLAPIFNAVAPTIKYVVGQLATGLSSPGFKAFVDFIKTTAGPAIYDLAQIFMNFGSGFGGIVQAFGPLALQLMNWLVRMSASFAKWGQDLSASKGFHEFLAYVAANGPRIMGLLSAAFTTIGHVIKALAPLGAAILPIVTAVLNMLNKIPIPVLTALAVGVGLVVTGMKAYNLYTGIASAITDLWGKRMKVAAIAQKVWTAAQWLFNLAMDANPIGLVIIAIAALVVGFIIAYKHSATLRAIIADLWSWIKKIGVAFYDDFLTPIGHAFTAAVGFVARFAVGAMVATGKVLSYIGGLPGKIIGLFSRAGSWLYNAGSSIVRGLWNGISASGAWLYNQILGWVKAAVPGPILKFLGIHSPSAYTTWVGQMVGQGLAKGIDQSHQVVSAAAGRLAGAAVPTPASATVGYGVAAGGPGGGGGGGNSTDGMAAALRDALAGLTWQLNIDPQGVAQLVTIGNRKRGKR